MTEAVVAGESTDLRPGALDGSYFQGSRSLKTGTDFQAVLLERFPPRCLPKQWAPTDQTAAQVLALLSGPPFLTGRKHLDEERLRGLRLVLAWLAREEGESTVPGTFSGYPPTQGS